MLPVRGTLVTLPYVPDAPCLPPRPEAMPGLFTLLGYIPPPRFMGLPGAPVPGVIARTDEPTLPVVNAPW